MSSRRLQEMSSRCLQDMFSRRVQDMSTRRLEDIWEDCVLDTVKLFFYAILRANSRVSKQLFIFLGREPFQVFDHSNVFITLSTCRGSLPILV